MLILIEHISREKSRSAVSRSRCHANEIISPGCALFLADSWTNGRMRRRDRAPHFPLLAPGPTPLTRSLSLPETEDGRSAASPIGQGDAEKALEEKSLGLTSSELLADYCSCMQPTSQSSATSELKEKVSSVASTAPRGACPIAASLPDSWSRAASQKSVHPGFFYCWRWHRKRLHPGLGRDEGQLEMPPHTLPFRFLSCCFDGGWLRASNLGRQRVVAVGGNNTNGLVGGVSASVLSPPDAFLPPTSARYARLESLTGRWLHVAPVAGQLEL